MNYQVTDEQVREFIIDNHSTMTNKEIANLFGRKTMQISSYRHWLNKSGQLKQVENLIDKIEKEYHKVGKFTNVSAKGKLEARQTIAKWIGTNANTKYPILTLPFEEWRMEKLIQNYTGKVFKYVACERDTDVFIKMAVNSQRYGKNNELYNGEIGDKIKCASEGMYSNLILDYCGILSSFSNEIILAVINKIVVVGGVIAVTLQKARDTSDIINKCYDASNKTSETKTEDAIRMFFKSLCLISDFEVVDELVYNDTTPMMLTILKRTK